MSSTRKCPEEFYPSYKYTIQLMKDETQIEVNREKLHLVPSQEDQYFEIEIATPIKKTQPMRIQVGSKKYSNNELIKKAHRFSQTCR